MRMMPSWSQVHKAEGLIDGIVHQRQIQLVVLRHALPVGDAGTAKRIHAQFQAGTLDSRHVDHLNQAFDIRLHQVFGVQVAAVPGLVQRLALNAFQLLRQQFVGALFDHRRQVGVGRAAVRRVVLDAAVFRWVMGRRNDDAVGLHAAAAVVAQNGVRYRRRWREAVVFLHDHIDAVGGQHFQHGNEGRLGQRMGVFAHVARAGGALLMTNFGDRLSDGEDVRFVKAVALRAAAVAGGAKLHRMCGIAGFRLQHIVLRRQLGYVDQIALAGGLPGTWIIRHRHISLIPVGDRANTSRTAIMTGCSLN